MDHGAAPNDPAAGGGARGGGEAGVAALGDLRILEGPMLGLFCSVRCPGSVILRTYDLARELRDSEVTVIGGFQTPMERECLALLLRGRQPVVVCPARGIEGMRVPPAWKGPLAEGRLLVLSPFGAGERRVTARLAAERNGFVASMADAVFVAHAAAGGATEGFCRVVAGWGKALLTLDDPGNANLVAMGARAIRVEDVRDGGLWAGLGVG